MGVVKPFPSSLPFELDENQRQAIEHLSGPMLVVAGAGTGKTTVLTRRIAALIREGHARPEEILAVTYTKNAAREMQRRVQDELRGMDLSGLRTITFHKYCDDLLHAQGKQFGVLDDKDLWIFLRRNIRELKLHHFVRAANVSKFLDDLLEFMRRCQDELVGPDAYANYVRRLEKGDLRIPRVCKSKEAGDLSDEEVLARCNELASVYATVERMLEESNLGTFGHMITSLHTLLQKDQALLERECRQNRFILIDEFQDANFAQVKILKNIAADHRNVFAVGDPDQAIYQFRGASSAAFTLFQRHFPGSRLVVLGKNRRSTTAILQSAFALVDKNPQVLVAEQDTHYQRSPLISAREEETIELGGEPHGSPVEIVLLTDKEGDAFDIVNLIRQRKRQRRCAWSDFAVLYRLHNHRDQLAAELGRERIPFSIENMDVLDTPEVRDFLACLSAVASDDEGAGLFRVAALPQFKVDPNDLRAGLKQLDRNAGGIGMVMVLRKVPGGPRILETIADTRREISETQAKAIQAARIVLRRFALPPSVPVQAVLEFISAWQEKPLTETGALPELLEFLKYFREARGAICIPANENDSVRLMTVHTAKGLEWDHVFILRANSSSFPSSYKEPLVEFPAELRDADSAGPMEGKTLHNQEERRLFYVAMTRARDALTIYARPGTGKDTSPAGFLRDLVKDARLKPWLTTRAPKAHQPDLFAQVAPVEALSRTTEWLDAPTLSNLGNKLSASAVQLYETCPLQFKLQREWRIPGDVGGAMQYGGSIHRVLRAYYDSVLQEREFSGDRLVEIFCQDLEQCGIEDPYQRDLYRKLGKQQLQDFLAACREREVPRVLHLEEPFEIRLGDTVVNGRIDRMDQAPDGQIVITDYKTGKPKSQDDADDSLQLSIYALAAREKWGYEARRLVFYNLQENSAIATQRTESQLQKARFQVQAVAECIAENRFPAKPGFHCNFCAFRTLCPATEKRVGWIYADSA